jgi:hypothetical protein
MADLGAMDLGLGGLGDALSQQVKDEDEERKKKLLQLGQQQQSKTASAMGLGAINLLGGGVPGKGGVFGA